MYNPSSNQLGLLELGAISSQDMSWQRETCHAADSKADANFVWSLEG